MSSSQLSRRLLGNPAPVVGFFGLAFAITLTILVVQLQLRSFMWDPEAVRIFPRLFAFEDYAASFLIAIALMASLVPQVQKAGVFVAGWLGRRPHVAAMLTGVVLGIGALCVYQAYPLAMDEYVPYFQSEAFAAGRLTGQLPPELVDWLVVPSFQGHFMHVSHVTGQVASAYWPGFALLLTPFTAIGLSWLCNPLLGAATVLVVWRLTLALAGSNAAAGAAMLFTLASPAFVINAISYYSMTAHFLCNAVFVLLLLDPTRTRAFWAGMVGGLALNLHNPVPHLLFALPWLVWLASSSQRRRALMTMFIGYLPWVVLIGFGWQWVLHGLADPVAGSASATPDSLLSRVLALLEAATALPDIPLLEARAIGFAKIWVWASPGFGLLAAIGFWRHRRSPMFQLLAASAVLTIVGYLFVPADQGHGWGFRYFHSAWLVLPVFAASAIVPARNDESEHRQSIVGGITAYALGAAVVGLMLLVPYFSWQVHRFIGNHQAQLPRTAEGTERILVVDPNFGYYASDLVQNDPFLRDSVIMMITHGRKADDAIIEEHFPGLVRLGGNYRGAVYGEPTHAPNPPPSGD